MYDLFSVFLRRSHGDMWSVRSRDLNARVNCHLSEGGAVEVKVVMCLSPTNLLFIKQETMKRLR